MTEGPDNTPRNAGILAAWKSGHLRKKSEHTPRRFLSLRNRKLSSAAPSIPVITSTAPVLPPSSEPARPSSSADDQAQNKPRPTIGPISTYKPSTPPRVQVPLTPSSEALLKAGQKRMPEDEEQESSEPVPAKTSYNPEPVYVPLVDASLEIGALPDWLEPVPWDGQEYRREDSDADGMTTRQRRALQTLLQNGDISIAGPQGSTGNATVHGEEKCGIPSFARMNDLTNQISPEPFATTLLVASPTHGQVQVFGLARLFSAHTIHATNSSVVVDANDCTLKTTDHYHIRTVVISLETLTGPGSPGHAALAKLLRNPGEGIAAFQDAMRQLAPRHEESQTQVSLPAARTHLTVIHGGTPLVQHGNQSRASVTTHYVIEEVELPIIELLAEDKALVAALVKAALTPDGAPAARAFVRRALKAAGRTDDLALLDYCTDLPGARTSVWDFISFVSVSNALAVMVGDDNQIRTDLQVKQGGQVLDRGPSALDRIREDATEARAAWLLDHPAVAKAEELRRRLAALTDPQAADDPSTALADLVPRTQQPADTHRVVNSPITDLGAL